MLHYFEVCCEVKSVFFLFQACAVMALERVPADIRKDGGVARMSDPKVLISNFCVLEFD